MHFSRETTISNFIWRYSERFGAQLVTFFVSIILARILKPSDYGTIALITIFITIMNVFVDSGLGTALIQKKDADDVDFSTVFYFNVISCFGLYLLMYFISPYIASFYNDLSLIALIRTLSLTIIISGLKNVQQAYVSKTMQFKKFFFSTLGGTIGAAIVGVTLACNGFGVWALVLQQLLNVTIDTLILWFTVDWRPTWQFSFKRLSSLFTFGWKLLASSLIDTIYIDLRQLIIGKMYSPSDLAFYNQGDKFPKFIVTNINSSIDSVLLPTMSNEQEDLSRIKNMTRRSIKISSFIMAPLMMGLAFCAPTIVEILLTEKWLHCVPYLQIFCITYMFYPIHTSNLNAIKAIGRSDLFLKLEIQKKVVGIILLLITMWLGPFVMACSSLITTIFSMLINSSPNKKILNYGYLEQMKDILPNVMLAIFMGLFISSFSFFIHSNFVLLVAQVLVGIIIYVLGAKKICSDSYNYLLDCCKTMFFNRK